MTKQTKVQARKVCDEATGQANKAYEEVTSND